MNWARHLKFITKLGVAALAMGALATSGKAQNALQGKFTLPFETRWGGATLPAGDYTFALPSTVSPHRIYIWGAAANAIVMSGVSDYKVASSQAQLNLVEIGGVETVTTFEVPELGLTFTYASPKQKHMGSKEARQKTAPQTAPASQASENRTSIEVRTASH